MKKTEVYKKWNNLWLVTSSIHKILISVTGLSKSQLFLSEEIENKFFDEINNCFKRLNEWEPLEYIINNAEFYSLDYYVDNRVLIPRDDTEILVDKVIEAALQSQSITLIDVWTWSSCIPISIIKNTTRISNCFAIDISEHALKISEINIKKHKLSEKIIRIHSNLIEDFIWDNNLLDTNKNVIITANLPYIKNNDFENIDKETLDYEPSLALYWGKETWFELYEKLIIQSITLKKQNKLNSLVLFIEIWFDQFKYSKQYLKKLWLKAIFYKDICNINRCLEIHF